MASESGDRPGAASEPNPQSNEPESEALSPVDSGSAAAPGTDGPFELDRLAAGPFEIGAKIAHFTLAERLGGGAMAAVYRATDEETGQSVALKLLLPGADAVMRERFRREARTASVLDHRHIVPTLEVGQASLQGVAYIAMELIEGYSLSQLLELYGRLDPTDACLILAPVAEALAFAHARGIVHRDVKPSNILLQTVAADVPGAVRLHVLDEPVAALLSDFGIARALDAPDLTSAGRTIGTPAFMAPEQCAGSDEIDGRADIYALGAVLYRCLVGRAPFTGSTTQILHAHVYDPLLIPDEAVQRLPQEALDLMARSMMKDPAGRFQDARDMAHTLREAAESFEPPEEGLNEPGEEATRTMASLPVTQATSSPSSRILVPALPARASSRTPPVAPSARTGALAPRSVGAGQAAVLPSADVRTAVVPEGGRQSRRSRRRSLGMWILGSALALLLVVALATLVSSVVPGVGLPGFGSDPAEPTEPAIAIADGTAQPTATRTQATGTVDDGAVAATTPTVPVTDAPTPVPTLTGPTATPTEVPPPAVPLASAWDDAQAFYAEQDWQSALDWLIVLRRVDQEFERERVESMLVVSYAGLATEASLRGQYDRAAALWENALAIDPDNEYLLALERGTQVMGEGDQAELASAREVLQEAHASYAEALFIAGEPCAAAEQMNAAVRFLRSRAVLDRQVALLEACEGAERAAELAEVGGSLIYSSQEGEAYRIFRQAVIPDSPSTLLVDAAAQPALSPDGRMIAFYSRRTDFLGLAGLDLTLSNDPGARSLRFSEYSEDARDAPPSWSSEGDRLAFTSTSFGDDRYRIYVTSANGDLESATLGYGKDPAWHPWQDLLVFNGTDETGNNPGLWLMRSDGSGRTRLTDNGNDIRPVWTPDGQSVVFMSSGRDGNWEVYRVNVVDQTVMRLTANGGQDGLPAVSPDGTYVAYMSDRDGYWRVYYVPFEGGEAQLLADISGQLPNWLEHSMQWIN